LHQLDEALAATAAATATVATAAAAGSPSIDAAATAACRHEFDPVEIPWLYLPRALPVLGPAVLTIAVPAQGHLALLAARGRRRLTLLAPTGQCSHIRTSLLARTLRQAATEPVSATLDPLLASPPLATLSRAARHRARQALAAAHLAAAPGLAAQVLVQDGAPPSPPPAPGPVSRRHSRTLALAAAPFLARCIALAAAILGTQALSSLAWLTLGAAFLAGRIETSAQTAWALLVLSLPCAHAFELAAANALADRAALRLRRRLFAATLALPPDTLREDGSGQLLGRLLAAESFESALLAGAPAACVALAELAGAALAMAHGAAPAPHLVLLGTALTTAVLLAVSYARTDRAAATSQRALTGHLVEDLAGHRTHRAQGPCLASLAAAAASDDTPTPPSLASTDSRLAAHHACLRRLGHREILLGTALPRAWLLAGLGVIAATVAAGAANASSASAAGGPPPASLALSIGGLLLAQGALGRLAIALRHLATAWTARREILPILAAARPHLPAPPAPPPPLTPSSPLLLEARQLTLRLPNSPAPLLDGAALAIRPGDRILLTGPSGAGKSTLAALLAGYRQPDSGLLLLGGYDLPTLGTSAWRSRVVAVPQLHANHLFAGTLAWNLLLGRAWPPTPRDLAAAAEICRDLGLGPLLDRFPAGLDQLLGDAGWRLSDGEAARVCLARALLQDPDLLILDESLGALDPALRLQVLAVLDRRARALLLIAHPDPA
jgi:ATP-binding cassette subfamily B protein